MQPDDALRRIPGWESRSAELRPFEGGLTNRTFKVDSEGESFVLRLESVQSMHFRLDRETEARIVKNAADAGLTPELLYADHERGITLTRFVPGEVWAAHKFEGPTNIDAFAATLRKVHALPRCGVTLDPVAVVRKYATSLAGLPEMRGVIALCERVAQEIPLSDNVVCCHNDLVASNIIETPDLMFLDWEYACDNDPLYDLACTIGYHDLTNKQVHVLLSAYAGEATGEMHEKLQRQIRLFDAIQCLWYATRQTVAPNAKHRRRVEFLQERIG